jgi:hypothetical protein
MRFRQVLAPGHGLREQAGGAYLDFGFDHHRGVVEEPVVGFLRGRELASRPR